jgi:hypothetical protein
VGPVPLLLIDLLVGALALTVLVFTGLALWHRIKGLTQTVRAAAERLEAVSPAFSDRPTT